MKAKIKICGITSAADARLAVDLGADLLGFNFYRPSPRYIEPVRAAEIINSLGEEPRVLHAGLFVQTGVKEMEAVLRKCPLDVVQLHSDESIGDCEQVAALGVEIIKAFRVKGPQDIDPALEFPADYILLDAFRADLYGGTGHTFDWGWIEQTGEKKIFLAGGIEPDNIAAALAVGTYGVDLCSGVEKIPGVKDRDKMKKLFAEITRYYERQ